MKLKSQPSDFEVTELTEFQAGSGPFSLYQLCKSSLGTPEAINAVLRSWNLARDRISYGGLKDRHARTVQHVTIFQGPKRDLADRSFVLKYLGQAPRHFTAHDIAGNQFSMHLRGIARQNTPGLTDRLEGLRQYGLVNYFDEQRFGSLGISGRFIAEPWCKGDYQSALFLALAEPNRHDRKREAEQKSILRQFWGDWKSCKDRLDRSHRRSIVTYLVDHPEGFKRGISLLRSDLRSIYIAAFQSALWNRWLARIIDGHCQPNVTVIPTVAGQLVFPCKASPNSIESASLDWLKTLQLPLPSARQHQWPIEFVQDLDDILEEFAMTRRELRLKYPRDTFFSKGQRDCWLRVNDLENQWKDDERSVGRQSLHLKFWLPRGAYATMVVKLLQTE